MTAAPPPHPFVGMTISSLLEHRARTSADRTFLVDAVDGPRRTLTYGEFARQVDALAEQLRRRGVGARDHVLIHLGNGAELLIAWFACARLGAVAVLTSHRATDDELAVYASVAVPVGAFVAAGKPLPATVRDALSWLVEVGGSAGSGQGGDPFADLVRTEANPVTGAVPDALDPVSVLFTSGTTARPKGVVWTHANALWAACVGARHLGLSRDDVNLVHMPLHHTNALGWNTLPTMWAGGRVVLLPAWSTSRFWDMVRREACTRTSLVNFTYRALLGTEIPDRHGLRYVAMGRCDLPTGTVLGLRKTIGWWGMTETVAQPVMGDPDLPNRTGSMGRPTVGYEVRIRDSDGAPAGFGEPGELQVRGRPCLSLFAGYLGDAAATSEAFDDGWLRTGDVVTRWADGHLDFVGRAKDVLRIGAENVAASEIEQVIERYPGVVEAAVVGRDDPMLDEVPVAFVIVREPIDLAGLARHCAEVLADFKRPREFRVVDELPRSTIHKVDKPELRRVAASGGGSRAQR